MNNIRSLLNTKYKSSSLTSMFPKLKVSPKPKTFPSPTSAVTMVARPRVYQAYRPPVSMYKNVNVILEKTDSTGTLYLSDFSAAMEKNKLKREGVKTVLTVAIGLNIQYNPASGIKHYTYPAFDIESFDLSKYFEETYEAIESGLKNGGVLVHCAAGISRSATIVIAYLMKKNKWSYQEAYNFVRKKRNVICPNSGFVRQLRNYEKKLKAEA